VTSEADLPLFLAYEMSETSLDTIFLLMKIFPWYIDAGIIVVSNSWSNQIDIVHDNIIVVLLTTVHERPTLPVRRRVKRSRD
jgi:hypothetical protein